MTYRQRAKDFGLFCVFVACYCIAMIAVGLIPPLRRALDDPR